VVGQTVSILEGSTFVVSDRRGDVVPSPTEPHGLFLEDTRFLSCWRLDVHEGRLVVAESTEAADLVVELTEDVLLGMARGEQNPSTAFLTGSVKLVGDLALAPRLERFMPEPPGE
jgi:hypothetical protein